MQKREMLAYEFLKLSAYYKVIIRIRYRHLDNQKGKKDRYAYIQPIDWSFGRNGLHILAWDVQKENWRRFAVKNILEVTLTDIEWTEEIESKINFTGV